MTNKFCNTFIWRGKKYCTLIVHMLNFLYSIQMLKCLHMRIGMHAHPIIHSQLDIIAADIHCNNDSIHYAFLACVSSEIACNSHIPLFFAIEQKMNKNKSHRAFNVALNVLSLILCFDCLWWIFQCYSAHTQTN